MGRASGKLDAALRDLLARAPAGAAQAAPGAERSVSVLVRGRARFTPEQLEDLAGSGIRVRAVFKEVLTADVPIGVLQALCDRAYVLAVGAAGPLFPEPAPGAPPPPPGGGPE